MVHGRVHATPREGADEGGWVEGAHMLQCGSLIRVWVAIHPQCTVCKVRSLWVWVGSHPWRTATLWFIYITVHKHRKLVSIWYAALLTKSWNLENIAFKLCKSQSKEICVWVVLHPRRTGKLVDAVSTETQGRTVIVWYAFLFPNIWSETSMPSPWHQSRTFFLTNTLSHEKNDCITV